VLEKARIAAEKAKTVALEKARKTTEEAKRSNGLVRIDKLMGHLETTKEHLEECIHFLENECKELKKQLSI
jgi:hypothetical protein